MADFLQHGIFQDIAQPEQDATINEDETHYSAWSLQETPQKGLADPVTAKA